MGAKWIDQDGCTRGGALREAPHRGRLESTFLGKPMTAAEENTLLHYAGHCHDGANCPACDSMRKYMDAYLEATRRAEEAEYRPMRPDAFANSIIEG